jgi:putative Holliday junction resolvase
MSVPRVLCLDLGKRRVGLAVSDELGLTAQGLPTIEIGGLDDLVGQLTPIVSGYSVAELVVGLPRKLDGTDTDLTPFVLQARDRLEDAFGLPVRLFDERLTSRIAQQAVHEMGHKLKGRKKALDRISASIILTDYLSRHGKKTQ